MKRSTLNHVLCLILLFLLSWTNVFAQLGLGPNGLINEPAPTLVDPGHIDLGKPGYVGKVGGIAFGAMAMPAEGLKFTNVSLDYRPKEQDGNRLWITVDGQRFPAPIYDWQLVPIAKFVESPYKSCVTLLGKLDNPEKAEQVRKSGGSVINYHPAFVDSLLGLRLFQLDILLTDPEATDLPAQNGKYLLGAGETPPDVAANNEGRDAFYKLNSQPAYRSFVKRRSFVITDEGRDIRFGFDGGRLNISGNPYIFLAVQRRFIFPDVRVLVPRLPP